MKVCELCEVLSEQPQQSSMLFMLHGLTYELHSLVVGEDVVQLVAQPLLSDNQQNFENMQVTSHEFVTNLIKISQVFEEMRACSYCVVLVENYKLILYYDMEQQQHFITLVANDNVQPIKDLSQVPFSIVVVYKQSRNLLEEFQAGRLLLCDFLNAFCALGSPPQVEEESPNADQSGVWMGD